MDSIATMARMLAVNEQAQDSTTESIAEAEAGAAHDAVPERPGELIERVASSLEAPPEIDPGAWGRARDIFLAEADSTLARVAGRQPTAPGDSFVMEAIVITDGSRPSFTLSKGEVDVDDPFMGKWNGSVSAALASGSAKLAKSVGRIQPVGGHASKFSGTGTLVKVDPGLVLTNYHVIQHAKNRFGVAMTPAGDHWKVDGDLEIDFAGEAGSSDEQRFRIIEVRFPQGSGETFAGIDAAICRIVPHNGDTTTVMPKPAEVLSANDDYINGSITSLALIGFPAPPQFDNQDVDWDWVVRTLFGNRFGVKRLAPGLFTEKLGNNQNDTKKLAIGHDATTFGGASGSLVAAWLDNKTPAFALHFGGLTRKGNYALSFKAAQAALAAIGVPV